MKYFVQTFFAASPEFGSMPDHVKARLIPHLADRHATLGNARRTGQYRFNRYIHDASQRCPHGRAGGLSAVANAVLRR